MILFTSSEGPSLERVWQFPTDSQQTIIIWRETDVSRGSGMCLNIIFNLYIACVLHVYQLGYLEFKTITAASGTIALGSKAPSFCYILNAVIFLMARPRFEPRVDKYIILYKRLTRFSCDYSVILTVLWNFNMHICFSISIHSLFSHILPYTITLQWTRIYVHMFQMRAQFTVYCANRFCWVLPMSKCYSSKTCLMCIICTLEYVRCSNGTMNSTSTLILWYRLLTDLRALMNL